MNSAVEITLVYLTFFFNGQRERILPGRILRKYKGINIELDIDDEGMVKQLRPTLV